MTDRPSGIPPGVRVLVVEDSVDHQLLMRRTLEREGFTVRTAATVEEARARLANVDLVLLDYRLPDDTGIELLGNIRAMPRAPSVIMVTGAGNTDVAVRAMRLGAVDYVTKDGGYLDELPDVVHRAWRHHDLSRRAVELQQLALLVTSAQDRVGLFAEIVSGAARLLRARACVLLLAEQGVLRPATQVGDPGGSVADLLGGTVEEVGGDGAPRHDGERLLVPLPRDDGSIVGLLVAWPDAHRHRSEELELAQVFASFAGVALRNLRQRELEQALVAQLQQTVDARRDFITSVSHELRTPMTSIAGFATTLYDHWGELEGDERLAMLERIMRNADDLRRLVEEMVDLAALDRGQAVSVDIERLGLARHVEQATADAGDILAGRQVTVEVEPVEVDADPALLRRTLHNLLTNAVKYSADGSPIHVRSYPAADHVRIEVEDEGIGLAPSVAARVFDPFFRDQPAVANAVRGAGIGLALVKEYVRTMGGEVGVRSVPGRGSTFWFTLPRGRAAGESSDISEATAGPV